MKEWGGGEEPCVQQVPVQTMIVVKATTRSELIKTMKEWGGGGGPGAQQVPAQTMIVVKGTTRSGLK